MYIVFYSVRAGTTHSVSTLPQKLHSFLGQGYSCVLAPDFPGYKVLIATQFAYVNIHVITRKLFLEVSIGSFSGF